jgi:NAD(P)H-dependent flavin oxidoreductase YrpB (nitropropane dioxygenase family)
MLQATAAHGRRRGTHNQTMRLHDFFRRLAMTCPIIQAPMAGGGDTPELAAAVSNSGGLGFIGAAYLTPEQIHQTGERM